MRATDGAAPLAKGLACSRCKARKTRCSGEKPACAACLRSARFKHIPLEQVVCQYGEGSVDDHDDAFGKPAKAPRLSTKDRKSSASSGVSSTDSVPSLASSSASRSASSLFSYETEGSSLYSNPSTTSLPLSGAGSTDSLPKLGTNTQFYGLPPLPGPGLSQVATHGMPPPARPPPVPYVGPSPVLQHSSSSMSSGSSFSYNSPIASPAMHDLSNEMTHSLNFALPPTLRTSSSSSSSSSLSSRRRGAPSIIPLPRPPHFASPTSSASLPLLDTCDYPQHLPPPVGIPLAYQQHHRHESGTIEQRIDHWAGTPASAPPSVTEFAQSQLAQRDEVIRQSEGVHQQVYKHAGNDLPIPVDQTYYNMSQPDYTNRQFAGKGTLPPLITGASMSGPHGSVDDWNLPTPVYGGPREGYMGLSEDPTPTTAVPGGMPTPLLEMYQQGPDQPSGGATANFAQSPAPLWPSPWPMFREHSTDAWGTYQR